MAAFLTYVLLRGPWPLRALVYFFFASAVVFAIAQTIDNLRPTTERPVPAHVHHNHVRPARFVRR